MGWYDKFNDWYVRSIPEPGDGVGWQEPLVGSRERWRRNLPSTVGMLMLFVLGIAWSIHGGRHGRGGLPWGVSFEISAAIGAASMLISWLTGWYYGTAITFSCFGLTIGAGRGRKRIRLRQIRAVHRIKQDGCTVLAFEGPRGERARVFVPRDVEEKVIAAIRATGIACE